MVNVSEKEKPAKLNDYAESFLDYLKNVRSSPDNTVKAYRGDLRAFFQVIDKDPTTLTKMDMQAYLIDCKAKAHAPRTINRRLNCLQTFFAYMIDELELTLRSPISKQYKQKVKDKHANRSNRIRPEEAQRLMLAVKPKDTQAYLAMLLMGKGGLRISEAINLKLENIDWQRNIMRVSDSKGQDRDVPMGKSVKAAILECVMLRRKGNVILHSGGAPYSATTPLWAKVTRWMKKYGVVGTPHSWRRMCGTELYRATKDIVLVQRVLGHANIGTTRDSYIDDDDHDQAAARNLDAVF